MDNESLTEGEEQVSQDTHEAICKLTLSGSTPEDISLAPDLSVQSVLQVIARGDFDQEGNQCKQAQLAEEARLQRFQAQSEEKQANATNRDLAETSLQDTREALYREVHTFIYSYDTSQLYRTNLVTGEHSSLRYLHTPSNFTPVGVKCPEEAYLSLVEVLEQGR
jgi:hypothetical protein